MKARNGRRRGTLFVLIGILTILGVTFVAGVYTGRISLARTLVTTARVTDAETEPARRPGTRTLKPPEPSSPRLTFYHELTAPLTAPPPPPKPAKTAPPPLVAVSPEIPARQHPGEPAEALASAARSPSRYTVQIAAYRARPLAEALRETLATSGHDARVVESEASQGLVYRVQVGEFPTRDEARAAAARIAAERSLNPFVTPR